MIFRDDCKQFSPQRHIKKLAITARETKVTIVTAEVESPVFVQQSNDFYKVFMVSLNFGFLSILFKALYEQGIDAYRVVIPQTDHFQMIEQMVDPKYQLNEAKYID